MNGRGVMLAAVVVSTGCYGDHLRSNGALGHLSYGYVLDYEGGADLGDVWFETGYTHQLFAELTADGVEWVDGHGSEIVHHADGAKVETESTDSDVPGFSILAQEPGSYRLESMLGERVVDYIDLRFADPTHLDLITFVREPWQEHWASYAVDDEVVVDEGSQIAFLAIPMADDHRLAAEFEPSVAVDLPSQVVPDQQVWAVQEGGITTGAYSEQYFAIEPGVVTFAVSDPVHGVAIDRVVTIE